MSMLAVLLIAVGIADISRRLIGARWLPPVIGAAALVGWAMLAGLWRLGDLALLALASVGAVGWQVSCERSERTSSHQATPLVMLGGTITLLILLSGWASEVDGPVTQWVSWVDLHISGGRALTVLGVLLVQVATANQVVRLILGSVGSVKPVGQPQASDQLKGGRLLGPMERLLIVGLGVAGQLTLASAVVAAKSIIRFPEISAKRDRDGKPAGGVAVGIDDVTEYFLVGSLASWMLAFAGLALIGVTG
ncbi:MAG: hypothetical protein U5N53_09090 [Mycobacterium sp.]|nr:hypothetical protein [Mycobacterium sp.]